MQVWHGLTDWLDRRRAMAGQSIGLVPTMGALHRGHASLVERCRTENDITVVSIFVNPSQFNNAKDLERYPRSLESDLEILKNIGVDDVLAPPASELYPNGYRFRIEPDTSADIGRLMEGAYRPGSLQGVMTIVLKLLNLVGPDRAYFGEKDYQQLRTIRELVQDFFISTEIIACPTVRESSGLAMSSRNMLLSDGARRTAASLFRALTSAADSKEAREILEKQGFAVDYVDEHWGRRFAAASLQGVRLIDNVPLPGTTSGPD